MVGNSWKGQQGVEAAYTPTFTGFGTVSAVNFTWTRVGNRIKVMGRFTAGTTTATEGRVSLPGSLVSDGALIPSIMLAGIYICNVNDPISGYILIESGVGYVTFGAQAATFNAFSKRNGNSLCNAGNVMSMQFEFGVSGWNV